MPAVKLPLLPLRGVIVFPNMVLHLDVGRERSIKALDQAMVEDNKILLVAQRESRVDEPTGADLFAMGTVSQIKQMIKLPGGTIRVLVEGLNRARVKEIYSEDPLFEVLVEELEDNYYKNNEIEALMRTVLFKFEQYIKISKKIPPETLVTVQEIEQPGRMADFVASNLTLKTNQKQEILEAVTPKERLEKLVSILTGEMEILEIERKISLRVRKQMERTQRDYYLREQMKAIQKELGEKDERTAEADEYRAKIEKQDLPEKVKQKAEEEINRFERMPAAAAEAAVIRSYLDWLVELPWIIKTEDRLDLDAAEEILDRDHYGLEKVKERILEYLAVRQLTDVLKGPILCLVGPPGVGKTSLARSIANALERKFVRLSLGGVKDEAEIRGHRRTYVGALPGRIIQGMRTAGSRNPIFLLDEVDKIANDFRGDPSSALLEVLDPEQNNTFSDHYVELPFDLSQVMFITTANNSYTIPQPLLDRMETITIPGYIEEEKVQIALRHLIPKQLQENGLKDNQLKISESTLKEIIRTYTREAGVRNLERNIASLCRKAARRVVKDRKKKIRVTMQNLEKMLGVPHFRRGEVIKESEVGVSTGLAWTSAGGEILSIEVTVLKGKGRLTLTGKLGDVMRESAQAAVSYIRSRVDVLEIEPDFYEETDIHIHVPEGAIPKDGPSAGITMATAVVSALCNRPVSKDVAMTGEITLRGRVLPIGGLKEKALAAYRAGVQTIIIPELNKGDVSEIPDNIKRSLNFIFVKHMDQVLEYALVKESSQEDITADHGAGR